MSCARAVAVMVGELMEAEVVGEIGAELGERAPDARARSATATVSARGTRGSVRSSCRSSKLRSGPAYFPGFLEPRRRAEQAIVAVVMEAYVKQRGVGLALRLLSDVVLEQSSLVGFDLDS